MQYPFNDEEMVYDYKRHRYYLRGSYVLNELGENLDVLLNTSGDANPSTLTTRFLRRVSDIVYNWIYQDSMNHEWLEYIMALHPPLREVIKDMLISQTLYVLNNGFVADYTGLNIAKGQSMPIRELRGAAKVSDEVEMTANRFIPGLGYSLKYLGPLPCVPCDRYHKDY